MPEAMLYSFRTCSAVLLKYEHARSKVIMKLPRCS